MALLGFIAGVTTIGVESGFSALFPVWLWLFSLGLTLLMLTGIHSPLVKPYFISGFYRLLLIQGILLAGSFIFGSGYAHWQLGEALQQRITEPLEQTAIVRVVGISDGVGEQWRQVVETVATDQQSPIPVKWLLYNAVDWKRQYAIAPPDMQPGQLWQVHVKLKPAHSQASPGAFDVEKWLLQQHIVATGTLQFATQLTALQVAQLPLKPDSLITQINQALQRERLQIRQHFMALPATQSSAAKGVLLGLLTGDRSLIDADTTLLYH